MKYTEISEISEIGESKNTFLLDKTNACLLRRVNPLHECHRSENTLVELVKPWQKAKYRTNKSLLAFAIDVIWEISAIDTLSCIVTPLARGRWLIL